MLKLLIKPASIGSYIVIDQFIDFTKSRPSTFFEKEGHVVHTDMSNPYSETIRGALLRALKDCGVRKYSGTGTYACAEGPRYETKAEIDFFRRMGADVVGMTNVPEVVLAKEMEIPYATVALATNMAAGLQAKQSHEEVVKEMNKSLSRTKEILEKTISYLS